MAFTAVITVVADSPSSSTAAGAGAPHAAGDAIGRRQELEPAVAGQPAVAAGVDAARMRLDVAQV